MIRMLGKVSGLEMVKYAYICDAIRKKGPTVQKIDFRIMRDSISV